MRQSEGSDFTVMPELTTYVSEVRQRLAVVADRKLRRHLEAERRSAVAARRTWEELVAATMQLQRAAGQASSALTLRVAVDAVQELRNAGHQLSRAILDHRVDNVESDIRASARRLPDLVASALSADGIASIRASAETLGFIGCEVPTQCHAGANLVSCGLNVRRP